MLVPTVTRWSGTLEFPKGLPAANFWFRNEDFKLVLLITVPKVSNYETSPLGPTLEGQCWSLRSPAGQGP